MAACAPPRIAGRDLLPSPVHSNNAKPTSHVPTVHDMGNSREGPFHRNLSCHYHACPWHRDEEKANALDWHLNLPFESCKAATSQIKGAQWMVPESTSEKPRIAKVRQAETQPKVIAERLQRVQFLPAMTLAKLQFSISQKL